MTEAEILLLAVELIKKVQECCFYQECSFWPLVIGSSLLLLPLLPLLAKLIKNSGQFEEITDFLLLLPVVARSPLRRKFVQV